jgi:hypothetical protein
VGTVGAGHARIAAGRWWGHLLRQAGRADLVQANGNVLAWLVAGVSAPTVGAVLAAKRPRHPVGWPLLGLGASLGLTFLTDGYASTASWPGPGRFRRPAGRPSTAVAVVGLRPIRITHVAVGVTVAAVLVGRCRWWCAFGGPAGPSVSRCAGWRWPPCRRRWPS